MTKTTLITSFITLLKASNLSPGSDYPILFSDIRFCPGRSPQTILILILILILINLYQRMPISSEFYRVDVMTNNVQHGLSLKFI